MTNENVSCAVRAANPLASSNTTTVPFNTMAMKQSLVEIKDALKSMLSQSSGIFLSSLPSEYKKHAGYNIPQEALSSLKTWNDVLYIDMT